ncbi:MAG: tetratricopeptide repeat protein [Gammaproteobacteria bacterium]|nr:tetratricopeptide repeat protein [Gammaproteobacteria bacterium]
MRYTLPKNVGQIVTHGILPSKLMRQLRPECYSDTRDHVSYPLSASTLEYCLETITSHNQTYDFETFCRKLCERTICPNLRPQTGSDGGGDSKADSESYPVAEEISNLTYIGNANHGHDRWAFAFSAQKTWSKKVRSDVKKLAETDRVYGRIFFITSRFARARDRARIEDELSRKYSVPVTILDRSWIVNEIVDKNRTDLAFNYLGIGEPTTSSSRLGPTDYSRQQHLSDAEQAIEDPEAFRGMERQRATEALVAAKLSRNLERPRTETDGRFTRAIRLADENGSCRQKLEARYGHIWTAFWWFDDFTFLNNSYGSFENLALASNHIKDLELLLNINQLLVNSVVHGHMTREECQLDERIEKLIQALAAVAADVNRPNNSLEAEAAILRIDLNQVTLTGNSDALPTICERFSTILERAHDLSEFDVENLVSFIEITGLVAGNNPAYSDLVEQVADFVASRKSEGEGSLVLLNHAQKFDFQDQINMIRWLGKASIGLAKHEYIQDLAEATQLLTLAYRSAGLLWAARASCIFATASIARIGEQENDIPINFIPVMGIWAWIALELCHIPDLLFSIQLMNGFISSLPLNDESKSKIQADIQKLDAGLGCLFLNLDKSDLHRLQGAPDILDALGLFQARTSLLYALGYEDVLREDGSVPEEATEEDLKRLLSTLKNQPIAEQFRDSLILNDGGNQTLSTTVLGIRVEVEIDENDLILVAESLLGSLEAFFATMVEHQVAPHAEFFHITIMQSEKITKPTIETSKLDMKSTVFWPCGLQVSKYEEQINLRSFFAEVAGHVWGTTCMAEDTDSLLESLFADDFVQHRIAIVMSIPNNYSRVTSRSFSCLSDWREVVHHSYPPRNQTTIPKIEIPSSADAAGETPGDNEKAFTASNHRDKCVSSVINLHAWDQAEWRGCAYYKLSPSGPPYMAFLFENTDAAVKIFTDWRIRFGDNDVEEDIHISIIRHLPGIDPHHYCVQVSSKLLALGSDSTPPIHGVSRSLVITPHDSENLETFLTGYRNFGHYYLVPAVGVTNPRFFSNLSIVKRDLTVKHAEEVREHDIEFLALQLLK